MLNSEQYEQLLKEMKSTVYIDGEQVPNYWLHPRMKPAFNLIKATYDMAQSPDLDGELHELMTMKSNITGEKINTFLNIHRSSNDLVKRMKLQRALMRFGAGCFGARCIFGAVANALWAVTYNLDKEGRTDYHERFKKFVARVQMQDLVVMADITDPKGDRSKPPHQQSDPDFYLRIVEKRPDGIVVNGAKFQQSGAPYAHELLVLPTTAMGPDDADYSVAFTVPSNAEGVFFVTDSTASHAKFEAMPLEDIGAGEYSMHESAHVFFENVFVPNEQIFLCGEWHVTRDLVQLFTDHQRLASSSCRMGYIDLCMGASQSMADYNGVAKVNHIKDKLIDMSISVESICAMITGAAMTPQITKSGCVAPNTMCINAAKLYMNDAVLKTAQKTMEIGGGILLTRPGTRDLANPKIGPLLRKYHQGRDGVTVDDRLKMARLAETLSGLACVTPILSVIAAAPPAVNRLQFRFQTDFERNVKAAKRLAGIAE
jgi:4-hydroxybutyryl-CoA dehydratase/vinylacetyl-CoA-Delta-isomerase